MARIARWRFESGAQSTDSVGTNTLTRTGVTEETTIKKEGTASAGFINGSQKFSLANAAMQSTFPLKGGTSNNKVTHCFWYRPTSLSAGRTEYFLGHTGSSSHMYEFYHTNGALKVAVSNTITLTVYSFPYTLVATRWYHFGFSLDISTKQLRLRLWDDTAGAIVYDAVVSYTDNLAVIPGTGDTFYIGSTSWTAGLFGFADDWQVFDTILDTENIDSVRTTGGLSLNVTLGSGELSAIGVISGTYDPGIFISGLLDASGSISGDLSILIDSSITPSGPWAFTEQPDKLGYNNNPNFTNTAMEIHQPCGHWHKQRLYGYPSIPFILWDSCPSFGGLLEGKVFFVTTDHAYPEETYYLFSYDLETKLFKIEYTEKTLGTTDSGIHWDEPWGGIAFAANNFVSLGVRGKASGLAVAPNQLQVHVFTKAGVLVSRTFFNFPWLPDIGQSWIPEDNMPAGYKMGYVPAIANQTILMLSDSIILIAFGGQSQDDSINRLFVIKSTDAGVTWDFINIEVGTYYDMPFLCGKGDVVYCNAWRNSNEYLFKSTDKGTTWSAPVLLTHVDFNDYTADMRSMAIFQGRLYGITTYTAAPFRYCYLPYYTTDDGVTLNLADPTVFQNLTRSLGNAAMAFVTNGDDAMYLILCSQNIPNAEPMVDKDTLAVYKTVDGIAWVLMDSLKSTEIEYHVGGGLGQHVSANFKNGVIAGSAYYLMRYEQGYAYLTFFTYTDAEGIKLFRSPFYDSTNQDLKGYSYAPFQAGDSPKDTQIVWPFDKQLPKQSSSKTKGYWPTTK